VNDVSPGGAADRAGIKPGDVILSFNGQVIEVWGDLPPMVGANPPGTKADVLVSRDGEERIFEVTLDALESDRGGVQSANEAAPAKSNALGLAVQGLSEEMRRALGDPKGGVVITRVESDAAYRAGVREGDVILMINNKPVDDMSSFNSIVANVQPGKAVALRVLRDGISNFIAYTPG
jgi:serine protease Do